MCKILADLNDKSITLSVHYYGPGDLATGWEIKEIVDNAPFFDSFYDSYPLEGIENIDDYIIYLFSLKFRALIEMVPHLLQEDHKDTITTLSKKADNACAAVKTGDVIKFINAHIEEIFTLENHLYDIRDVTLELIKKYVTGIKPNVYSYLCSNFYWLIIDDFDSFHKTIKSDPSLFELLYPSGHLSDLQERRFNETLDIFANILKNDNETLKALVNSRIDVLCTDVEKLIPSISSENVMLLEGPVRKVAAFLQRINYPTANDFLILNKKVSEILLDKTKTDGQHHRYEIPIPEIIEKYTAIEPWFARLFSLTHQHVPGTNRPLLVSRLVFERDETHHMFDFCETNIPTDAYFTRSHQHALDIRASINTGTIIGILDRPEIYSDFAKLIMSAISFIESQIQREDEHLPDDWILLDRMLQTILVNRELEQESLQPLCYSAAMFICSFMEKLLRLFYIDKVNGNAYVPPDAATLGKLLIETNSVIVDVFGVSHVKHLAFFMSKCGDNKIGYNYRNRLAHWTEIDNSSLTISLVAELLWLFVDVLNTIFIHYIEQAQHTEKLTDLE